MTVGYGETAFPELVTIAAGSLIAAYQLGYGTAAFGVGARRGAHVILTLEDCDGVDG
jgi:hypothetical protein